MWVNTDSTSYQTALQLSSQATTGTQDSIIFVRNTFESNKWGFYDLNKKLDGLTDEVYQELVSFRA